MSFELAAANDNNLTRLRTILNNSNALSGSLHFIFRVLSFRCSFVRHCSIFRGLLPKG